MNPLLETLLYKAVGKKRPRPLARTQSQALEGRYALFSDEPDILHSLLSYYPDTQTASFEHIFDAQKKYALSDKKQKFSGAVMDARRISAVADLESFFHTVKALVPHLAPQSSLVIVSEKNPNRLQDRFAQAEASACQSALMGFARSLAKEVGSELIRVNVLQSASTPVSLVTPACVFFLSAASSYITGQVIALAPAEEEWPEVFQAAPLKGQTALVTGASRGIGKAIAQQLARAGAKVVGLDRPSSQAELQTLMQELNGVSIVLDLTSTQAAKELLCFLEENSLCLDVVVHNAGVTHDKTLKNMSEQEWKKVLEVNLVAQLRLNQALLESLHLASSASFISLSSINGLAGQRGQTNYASAKAALTLYLQTMGAEFPNHRFNAVAPGFIQTDMTASMPFMVRELGRRLNSLGQGGEPADVAHLVAFLAQKESQSIKGQVIRVCGQSIVGA